MNSGLLRFTVWTIAVALLPSELFSQWIQTNGPGGDPVRSLASSGVNLFAGTSGRGVFLSTNGGRNWDSASVGLISPNVWSIATLDTKLFAGTHVGVYLSTSNGASWEATPLTNRDVWSFATMDTILFAGTTGGVYRSTSDGASWTQANNGLTNTDVFALVVSDTTLLAGTFSGVFLSTNNGSSWTASNLGLTNTNVLSMGVSGRNIFAGTFGGGVFLSANNGTSWMQVNAGLTNTNIHAFATSGTAVFVGTSGGIFTSTNNGSSWAAASTGLTHTNVLSLCISDTNLFAGTDSGSVWRRSLSDLVTSVGTVSGRTPQYAKLEQNYPNPFNPSTAIKFSLSSKSFVSLKVFNVLGEEMSTLVSEELYAGVYSREWSGTDMPSGVYFYRLIAGSFVETRKFILLR